ncbi:MAG: dihydrodipicolinate synthase family protein [Acidobacteriaceae bacterium]
MIAEIAGIIPILATPFNDTGEVDVQDFAAIVESAIEDGAHAVAMFGLASEYYKLTDEERCILTSTLIRTARDRVPTIVSITHHSTEVAVREAIEAEQSGAHAIMVLPPFFLAPSMDSILFHVEAIAKAVHIPVILQYAPAQTGIDPALLSRLPVSMVKVDASPSIPALRALPSTITTLVGYMGLDLPDAVVAGCSGCMPTASLVRPFVKIWRLLQSNPEDGRHEHQRLIPLLQYMMQSIEFLVAAEKHLLLKRGIIRSSYCRKPCERLNNDQLDKLYEYVENV